MDEDQKGLVDLFCFLTFGKVDKALLYIMMSCIVQSALFLFLGITEKTLAKLK